MIVSWALFSANGSVSSLDMFFCAWITFVAVILLLVTTVMSSAHVATNGLSFSSVSHYFEASVIPSAANMNSNAEHIPPYWSPFFILILSPFLHIFNWGVLIMYFMSSSVASLYS